jgi:hypothetical protein
MGAPEHSPWRAPRDDLDDCPYQGTVLDFSIFQPYEVALVGEPGEADTQTLITPSTPPTCPTRWSPVAPRTTRRTRGSYPFWRIAPRAMAGRPPTSVRATPARTRRPTQRGWRGSSAFRRDRQIGGRPSILPGACTPEDGNVGKGSARNRPQVSGRRIPQKRPAVNRLLTVELCTGRLAAVARKGVARKGVTQKEVAQKEVAQKEVAQKEVAQKEVAQKEVAHGDHHRVRFLPVLPQASRRRSVSRPQNRRPLISSASVPLDSRDRSISWFCSGGPGPPTARYRTAASRGP